MMTITQAIGLILATVLVWCFARKHELTDRLPSLWDIAHAPKVLFSMLCLITWCVAEVRC